MKRILLSAIIVLFFMGTVWAQADIPNKDFENWENKVLFYDPVDWSTPNTFTFLAGVLVVMPDTATHSGDTCAKLVTQEINFQGNPIFAPGTVTLGTFLIDKINFTGMIVGGIPFTERPVSFKGYFKYFPQNNDIGMFYIFFTKWNEANLTRDTIGMGMMPVPMEFTEWTDFSIDVGYLNQEIPDSMNVIAMSSDMLSGSAGSTMYIDDFSLEMESGIEYDLMPEIKVKVFPNPASDQVYFEFARSLEQGRLIIYNVKGAEVQLKDVSGNKSNIDVGKYSPGTYYFHLMEGTKRVSSGSFIVK